MANDLSTFEKLMLFSKKFLIPILFVILGGVFMYLAFVERIGEYNASNDGVIELAKMSNHENSQADNTAMIIGAVACFVVALLSLLIVMGYIKRKIGSVLAVLFIPAIGFMLWKMWDSVGKFEYKKEHRKEVIKEVKQRLADVRDAQKAYKKANGHFTNDFNTLIEFVKNGKILRVVKQGMVPARKLSIEENTFLYDKNKAIDNNMSEMEALRLAQSEMCPEDLKEFKRDTIYVSVLDEIFMTPGKIEARSKTAFPDFSADSLNVIPYAGGQKMSMEFDTVLIPIKSTVFEITVLHPFLEEFNDTLSLGSVKKLDLSGNWER